MKKKSSKAYQEWRSAVMEHDRGFCVICGKGPKYNNAHHLVPNNFTKYALTVDNGIILCPQHHTLGKFSAHKNPIWFYEWMLRHRPEQLGLAISRLMEFTDDI